MPHVTVQGISKEKLGGISEKLKVIIVEASGANIEHVKIFYSPKERIDAPTDAAVDIYWMPRPQELCDKVAEMLTDFLKAQGHAFVQVTFTEFPGNLFYENNVHY